MKNTQTYFHNFELIDKNKKSILFIAGAGMDHRLVRSLKLSNAEFNKPLIIDLPGHGNSKGFSSNQIETYSKFLIDSLEDIDLNNLSLCGHSMGGLIALDMVLKHDFSPQSLILVNSIYPTRVSEALLAKAKKGNGHAADFIIKYGLHRRLLGIKNGFTPGDSPPSNEEQDLIMLDDLEACNNYHLNLDDLKVLEIPVSIILGSKDRLVDLQEVEKFTDQVRSKIYTMDEVGHFPFFEDPEELSKLISMLA
tara:strand:+ start:2267 stop:3019 length:753 start_codon:yes stop_codon:yes gene_type:complete